MAVYETGRLPSLKEKIFLENKQWAGGDFVVKKETDKGTILTSFSKGFIPKAGFIYSSSEPFLVSSEGNAQEVLKAPSIRETVFYRGKGNLGDTLVGREVKDSSLSDGGKAFGKEEEVGRIVENDRVKLNHRSEEEHNILREADRCRETHAGLREPFYLEILRMEQRTESLEDKLKEMSHPKDDEKTPHSEKKEKPKISLFDKLKRER